MFTINMTLKKKAPLPIYIQIKKQLHAYIDEENLVPDTALPNVKEVAKMAGVSIQTADMALRELINDGICYRRPKKGTFIADFKKGKRKVCGVFFSKAESGIKTDWIAIEINRGLTKEAEAKEVDLLFLSGDLGDCVNYYKIDGHTPIEDIILFGEENAENCIEIARKNPNLRFISLNYRPADYVPIPSNFIGIYNDDFSGAYQIMTSMLKQGLRKIAIFSFSVENENYQNRVKGYRQAMDNSEFECEVQQTNYDQAKENRSNKEIGRILAEDFFARGNDADVIMCVNDLIAEGVADYLKTFAQKHVDVCGYDNVSPEISRINNFSTVSIDFEAMGRQALNIVVDSVGIYPKMVMIPPQIIVRGSETIQMNRMKEKRTNDGN